MCIKTRTKNIRKRHIQNVSVPKQIQPSTIQKQNITDMTKQDIINRQNHRNETGRTAKEHDGAPPWNGQCHRPLGEFKPVYGAHNLTLSPNVFLYTSNVNKPLPRQVNSLCIRHKVTKAYTQLKLLTNTSASLCMAFITHNAWTQSIGRRQGTKRNIVKGPTK